VHERNSEVAEIDVSHNDEYAAIAFTNNDVAILDLSKLIPLITENIEDIKRNLKQRQQKIQFEYIYNGFHTGPITSLDICAQRSLIVTCSQKDSTVRV